MEIIETDLPGKSAEHFIKLTDADKYYLYESGRWAAFLGIIGFIGCLFLGLLALVFLFLPVLLEKLPGTMGQSFGSMSTFNTVIAFAYFCMALLYLVPSMYIFKFGQKMKYALNNDHQEEFTASLSNIKSCFKFWGIFTIVILGLYLIAIILPIISAIFLKS